VSKYSCSYEGGYKAIEAYDGHVSKFYCKSHVDDFARQVRTSLIVTPRKTGDGPWPCEADWPLPGEVPS